MLDCYTDPAPYATRAASITRSCDDDRMFCVSDLDLYLLNPALLYAKTSLDLLSYI